jgi:spore germination cell wall hydrolase CwlJ-like protein
MVRIRTIAKNTMGRMATARRGWTRGFALCAVLMGANSLVEAAPYGQEVMAAVLLAEARGEGDKGMTAVAEVIRRRADQKGVGILATLQPGAFSCLNGTSHSALLKKYKNHPLFPQALAIARLAYNQPHQLGNQTQGATHFTHKKEMPYWAVGRVPVATIRNHAFYRLPI